MEFKIGSKKEKILKEETEDFIKWMFENKENREFILKTSNSVIISWYSKNKNIELSNGFLNYHRHRWIKIYDEIYEKSKIEKLIQIPEIYEVIKDHILV